eukprot:4118187-Alexandrium_andersonii.AAC.1
MQFFFVRHSATNEFIKRLRGEQATSGSSSAGKSTGALVQSLTAGEASEAAKRPTRAEDLESLLADRPSDAKGAEQTSPPKPGD